MRFITVDFRFELTVNEIDLPDGIFNSILVSPSDPSLPATIYIWFDDPRINTGINPDAPVIVIESDFNDFPKRITLPTFKRKKIYIMKNSLQPVLTVTIWNR
jgi:hypothetical protein